MADSASPDRVDIAAEEHDRVRLAGSRWLLWRPVLVRSAGFDLDALLDVLAPSADAEDTDRWSEAYGESIDRAVALARSEGHRRALLWQNPAVLDRVVDRMEPAREARRNSRRRGRELAVMRYLQRYHTKNESIGFFGPIRWAHITPGEPALRLQPGTAVAGAQHVYVEDWAVADVADAVAATPGIRHFIPPALAFGAQVVGRSVQLLGGPQALTREESALVRLCDGRRPVADIAGELGRPVSDVDALVEALRTRGVLTRTFEVPPDLSAEEWMTRDLCRLVPPRERADAERLLRGLEGWRDDVASATTSQELQRAIRAVDAELREVTGGAASRTKDEAANGRAALVGLSERDAQVYLGDALARQLGAPLALVLESVRWFVARAGEAAADFLAATHRELSAYYGPEHVPFSALAQRLSTTRSWWEPVVDELVASWAAVLRPDEPGTRRVHLRSDALRPLAESTFASSSPGFALGLHHSPDVMIAAPDVETILRGEAEFVLGEVHASMVTVDREHFLAFHDEPGFASRLADLALRPDESRFVALQNRAVGTSGTGYPAPESHSARNVYLSFGRRIGERLVPSGAIDVADVEIGAGERGRLEARLPDGSRRPLLELMGSYLSFALVQEFRILPTRPHSPRVTIDSLTVSRETWRFRAGDWADLAECDEPEAFTLVRERAREAGLPRYVFWRAAEGVKPQFLDLESPVLVAMFVKDVRRAAEEDGTLVLQEMHPGPEQSWLTDAQGRRYTSELRMTVAEDRDRAW